MDRECTKNTKENLFMQSKLFALTSLLNSLDTKHAYEVKHEYLDYGADIKWMCINCLELDTGTCYQAITPRDWDDIYIIKEDSQMFKQLMEIAERIYFQANSKKLTHEEIEEAFNRGYIYLEKDTSKGNFHAVCKDVDIELRDSKHIKSNEDAINQIEYELYHTYRSVSDLDKQKLYEYVTDALNIRKTIEQKEEEIER